MGPTTGKFVVMYGLTYTPDYKSGGTGIIGLQIRFNVHSRLQIWRNGDHRIANPMKLDPMKLGMRNDLLKRNESSFET